MAPAVMKWLPLVIRCSSFINLFIILFLLLISSVFPFLGVKCSVPSEQQPTEHHYLNNAYTLGSGTPLLCKNCLCTFLGSAIINSKINGTPKSVCLPTSKLHSILAVANLLAHKNLWFCYYGQVNSLRLKSSVASKWERKHFLGTI